MWTWVCACACGRRYVRACMRACVRACVRACMSSCAYARAYVCYMNVQDMQRISKRQEARLIYDVSCLFAISWTARFFSSPYHGTVLETFASGSLSHGSWL